jgi:hypothetical protein
LREAGFPPVFFVAERGTYSVWYWVGSSAALIERPDDPAMSEELVAAAIVQDAARRGVRHIDAGRPALVPVRDREPTEPAS